MPEHLPRAIGWEESVAAVRGEGGDVGRKVFDDSAREWKADAMERAKSGSPLGEW